MPEELGVSAVGVDFAFDRVNALFAPSHDEIHLPPALVPPIAQVGIKFGGPESVQHQVFPEPAPVFIPDRLPSERSKADRS